MIEEHRPEIGVPEPPPIVWIPRAVRHGESRVPPAFYHVALKCCNRRWGFSQLPVRNGEPPCVACKRCGKPMQVSLFRFLRWLTPEEIARLTR